MKTTVKLSKTDAMKLYNGADATGKQLLEKQFGRETFIPLNIMDQVKSFADACKIRKENPKEVLPFKNPKTDLQDGTNAFYELATIREVLNEGNELDYADGNQKKWFAVHDYSVSQKRFVFVFSSYRYTYSFTSLGSRLSLFSQERADYMGRQFEAIYNRMYGKGSPKK